MGLMDALKKEFCFYPLEGKDKQSVLTDLIEKFCAAYGFDEISRKHVEDAVFARETLCSTGLENGIAIPHAKLDFIKNTLVALAVSRNDIDFGAPDGKTTKVFFLVLGSTDKPSEHVQVLSQIAKLAKNTSLIKAIRNVGSSQELSSLVLQEN